MYCDQCGNENNDKSKFCHKCGKSLAQKSVDGFAITNANQIIIWLVLNVCFGLAIYAAAKYYHYYPFGYF